MTNLSPLQREALREAVRRGLKVPIGRQVRYQDYRSDPQQYAEDILGVTLTPAQCEIMLSVRDNRRTAVKASHAIGKTFTAGILACWWYDCWDQHIVYVTAPTWSQCKGLTFKQIRKFRRAHRLPGEILETGLVRDLDKELEPGHFIKALNAESGEGFQGEHSAPILIVLEEATGVPGYIWEASDGLMTHPECRLLAIGNPTDEATPFGDACGSPVYNVLSVSALDHPNIIAELQGEEPPFPDAVRLLWLQEMIEKECESASALEGEAFEFPAGSGKYYQPNAVFQGRALGQFPTQADQQVIPRAWIENLPVLTPVGLPEIGADIARFGTDRTTIAIKQGPCALKLREIRKMDTNVVTGAIIEDVHWAAMACQCDAQRIPIKVDVTGGLGTGPYDNLKAQGYNAVAINSSGEPIDKETFINVRSELWWATRERARTKELDFSRLPKDMRQSLIKELAIPKWKPDNRGRKVVDDKQKIKDVLGMSPDLADAWNLACYAGRVSQPISKRYDHRH